jgi:DNA-binding CsgD family transcriptional regulator
MNEKVPTLINVEDQPDLDKRVNQLINKVMSGIALEPKPWRVLIRALIGNRTISDITCRMFDGAISHHSINGWLYTDKSPSAWRQRAIVNELLEIRRGRVVRIGMGSPKELKSLWKVVTEEYKDDLVRRLQLIGVCSVPSRAWASGKRFPPMWAIRYLSTTIRNIDPATVVDRMHEASRSLAKSFSRKRDKLDAREIEVMSLFYGFEGREPTSLRAIADDLHISHETVRMVREKALSKIGAIKE